MPLNLHRAQARPDWQDVPPGERSSWQRLAARTNGIVTPGNLVTVVGFGLSMWGVGELIGGHTWWSLILLAVGRLLDIVDGSVAQATGTKSHLGEILDAAIDKAIIGVTVVAMFIAQVAPTWLLGLFLLPHVVIVVITFAERLRHVELHPTRLGKTTALLAWLTIPLILLTHAIGFSWHSPVGLLVMIFALVSAAFGFITANSYLQQQPPK